MTPFTSINKHVSRGITLLVCISCISCAQKEVQQGNKAEDPTREILVKRRVDGTRSSVNQLDEYGYVHGLRVTYYSDGKTIHSKLTLDHGIKHGPFIRYYRNGQVFEHTGYKDGKKHGPSRKYYKNGNLMAEYEYMDGFLQPGLQEFLRDGTRVTDYPEILFEEVDHLESWNRLDLRVYSKPRNRDVNYYLKQVKDGQEDRIYLISENGSAETRHYVKPGDILHKKVKIVAEIPTKLGNILVRELSYDLVADHTGQASSE